MVEPDAPIVVLGAGGHARVLAEALMQCGLSVTGHLAPEPDKSGRLGPYLGADEQIPTLIAAGHRFALGIGFVDAAGAARRKALVVQLPEAALVTVIHPSAIIAPSAEIGPGAFIAAGAVVGTDARIGASAIINTGALVDHDCRVGSGTHVATGARLAGSVTTGTNCLIGLGASLRQGITLGDHVIVGAGAVLVGDVATGATVIGLPARARGKA